jgi:hypothetical protein
MFKLFDGLQVTWKLQKQTSNSELTVRFRTVQREKLTMINAKSFI